MPDALTPDEMRFESIVRSEQRNMPLCEALTARFTYHNLEEWTKRVQQGDVLLRGATCDPETIVHTGDAVTYIVRNYTEPIVPTHYEVLYENEEFLVAGKPAGVPVHHTGSIFWNTFTSILRRTTGYEELIPMHRLDRDTSGIMLFAKSQDTALRYQKSLTRILLRKLYVAVVRGNWQPDNLLSKQGVTLLGDTLDVQIPLREQPGNEIRVQMIPDFEQGKACRTVFRRIDVRGTDFSVVQCELFTGRKHQIRAHLAALGHSIVGDCIYSHRGVYYLKRCMQPLDANDIATLGASSQLLHAWKMELQLPGWREPRWIESRIWTNEMGTALLQSGI
jgi:23S rRNA pseudouridine1911/1915/1917 synthase